MIEGGQPSDLGAQPVGEVARVAEGLYGLKMPVPLPLRFACVYLVEGDEGWTLVDAGYDYPPTYERRIILMGPYKRIRVSSPR